MNLFPEWLTALNLRRAAPDAEPDFGDMGTAFGLDASMGPDPGHAIVPGRSRDDRPSFPSRSGSRTD